MENQIFEFTATESLQLENSFGVIRRNEGVKLNVTVGINSDDYGWFEFYDEKTGGEDWYAEGSLTIEGNSITGYDGVFYLPSCVTDKLEELGFDISEII